MFLDPISIPDDTDPLDILSVAEMKENLRISYSAEDQFIARCIKWSYQWLDGPQGFLRRALLEQSWKLTLPGFSKRDSYVDRHGERIYQWVSTNSIELPLPPLKSVESVKYMIDGVQTTLDTSVYEVIRGPLFGSIALTDGASWPKVDTRSAAVEISFTCGYGDGFDIKERHGPIENAMRLLASDYFRNREDTYAEPRLVAVNRKIINGLERTLRGYRVMNRYA